MKKSFALICLLLAAACGENASTGGAERAAYPDASTPEGAGRLSFGQCAVCHTAAEGQPHRIGPNLYGVVGATAGKMDGFAYSAAMRDSGVVWTEEALDAFLENPQNFMRGNRMAYMGESDAETRSNIIAYMKSLGDSAN